MKLPIIGDPDKADKATYNWWTWRSYTIGDPVEATYNWSAWHLSDLLELVTLILVQSPMTNDSGTLLATATYTHSKDFTTLLATTCRTVSHSCIIVKHLCSCKLTQSFINHTSSLLTNSPLPLAQANAILPHAGVITTAQCHNSPTLDYMVSQLPPFFSISILASIP